MVKTSSRNIPVYICSDEIDAINSLAITSELWEGHPYSSWLTRGQGKSTWKLEATIYRGINWNNGNNNTIKSDILRKEYRNMQLFKTKADQAGLSIPGDEQIFRTFEGVDDFVTLPIANKCWPPIQAFDTLAFIQHHGMATQLLDFTKDPYVALYFAAKQHLDQNEASLINNDDEYFSVWIINSVATMSIHYDLSPNPYWPRYAEITSPYALNEFLKRQKGCFLLDRKFASSDECKTIDEVVIEKSMKRKLNSLVKEPIKRIDVNSLLSG